MSLMFAGMETVFKTSSSLFNLANPALVMGIFSMNLLLPVVFQAASRGAGVNDPPDLPPRER